jgi:hypothetical protein
LSAVVQIIPLDGWQYSKHSTLFKVFSDPTIELSMPNNCHNHISNVLLVPPIRPVRDAKVGHFQCNFFTPLAVALLFRRAAVYWPSSSRNVYYVNGQTDRILVPYWVDSIKVYGITDSAIHYVETGTDLMDTVF